MSQPENTKPRSPGRRETDLDKLYLNSESGKPTNPKQQFGVRKVPIMSVISMRVLAGVALAMLEGALKYARHNYRVLGVRASTYVDAATRHIAQYWEGEDIDKESKAGLHHIDKAIASLFVLRDSILRGNVIDDRPPTDDIDWTSDGNKIARALVDAFPNPPEPCTELAEIAKRVK